VDGKASPAGH